jgi:hypothetical protein
MINYYRKCWFAYIASPPRSLGLDPDHHSPSRHKHDLCHDATNSSAVLYGIGGRVPKISICVWGMSANRTPPPLRVPIWQAPLFSLAAGRSALNHIQNIREKCRDQQQCLNCLGSDFRLLLCRQANGLNSWLADWLAGWLTDCNVVWLAGSLTYWLIGWLEYWRTDW